MVISAKSSSKAQEPKTRLPQTKRNYHSYLTSSFSLFTFSAFCSTLGAFLFLLVLCFFFCFVSLILFFGGNLFPPFSTQIPRPVLPVFFLPSRPLSAPQYPIFDNVQLLSQLNQSSVDQVRNRVQDICYRVCSISWTTCDPKPQIVGLDRGGLWSTAVQVSLAFLSFFEKLVVPRRVFTLKEGRDLVSSVIFNPHPTVFCAIGRKLVPPPLPPHSSDRSPAVSCPPPILEVKKAHFRRLSIR